MSTVTTDMHEQLVYYACMILIAYCQYAPREKPLLSVSVNSIRTPIYIVSNVNHAESKTNMQIILYSCEHYEL